MRNGDFDGNPHFPGSTEFRSRRSSSAPHPRIHFGTASMLFGSAPLNADLGGEPGGARHALPRILKLVKTCSPLLVVISLLETEINHERRIMFDGDRLRKQVQLSPYRNRLGENSCP